EAVRRLQDQGLIERTPGRGSQRVGGSWEQPLGTIYSLYQSVEARGLMQSSTVMTRTATTDPAARAILGTDGPLFYLERVRRADSTPIATTGPGSLSNSPGPCSTSTSATPRCIGNWPNAAGSSPKRDKRRSAPCFSTARWPGISAAARARPPSR